MFIDTHCHLTDEYCANGELDAVIARANAAGVARLVCSCADPDDISNVIAITDKYDNLFCTVGIHPEYGKQNIDIENILSDEIFKNPKVIGIGEIGLDYHYGTEFKLNQIELFETQLLIAKKHDLPVAIHTRDAESDTAQALGSHDVNGVMHCYTGSWDMARKMLDRGFFFSAGGILTFKNADEIRDIFRRIPTDRIVIETDAPYLAPVPYRGKKCEPFMVIETARALANIKNLHLEELAIILMQNTKTLYPKIKL